MRGRRKFLESRREFFQDPANTRKISHDLVRCRTCRVVVTKPDLEGHQNRHGKNVTFEPAGSWIPLLLRYDFPAYLLVLVCFLVIACGPKCPKCPPPLPQKVVEVQKPCMEPLPRLTPPVFPDPEADGSVRLPPKELGQLMVFLGALRGYLQTQLARCGEEAKHAPTR